MKITATREALLRAAESLQAGVEKRETIPILSSILFQAQGQMLTLYSTDLEVSVRATIPSAKVLEEGETAIPGRRFLEMIRELPIDGEVTLNTQQNHWVTLTCQDDRFSILALSASDFPQSARLPQIDGAGYRRTQVSTLDSMLSHVISAVPSDQTLYHLHGALLEPLENGLYRLVATDLYRLAHADAELFLDDPGLKRAVFIPKKGLIELKRLISQISTETLELAIEKSYLGLRTHCTLLGTELIVRLVEGEYVDYRRILPKSSRGVVRVDRDQLHAAIKKAAVLSSEKAKAIRFSLSPKTLEISCNNPEAGEFKTSMPCDYAGEGIEMGFNMKYLLECLESYGSLGDGNSEQLELLIQDKGQPVLVKVAKRNESELRSRVYSESELRSRACNDMGYVIMPMRL